MSAIVGEIVFIAVILVAAVMFAGFTFGIFSIYESPAAVTVQGTTCSSNGNTTMCLLTLTNIGSRNTQTGGTCYLDGGNGLSGSVVNGGTVPAGGSLQGVQCVAHGSGPQPGSEVSGTMSLANGAVLYFIGTLE